MKILSSNIHLDAQRHHQVEQRAQLEVSLEKGGDTYTLSQEWERREEQSSTTQQTSQMSRDLSSDVQQKSLSLLGKLRRLGGAQAQNTDQNLASGVAGSSDHPMLSRPAPQAQDRLSLNPAGRLNRGRRMGATPKAKAPEITGDQAQDAKLYAFSLLVSKMTQKSVHISKLSESSNQAQDASSEVLDCAQGAICERPEGESNGLLEIFYGVEREVSAGMSFGVSAGVNMSPIAGQNQPVNAPAVSNQGVFNGVSRVSQNESASAQRVRLDIGNPGEGIASDEIIEINYTEERIESERLDVSGCGSVKLEDGREICFDLDMSMERYSAQKLEIDISNRQLKDPLIIDFGAETASFTDERFEFDIDADGELDSVSKLDHNGGILVMDHDQDGIVDDGTEVIGALSSDAFGDLRALDDDHNGWIDEGDAAYEQLSVWIWNEEGEQELSSLSDSNVGAIYLGAIQAEFSHMDDQNQLLAQQRSQSIYLKNSGEVGSARQVDIAV